MTTRSYVVGLPVIITVHDDGKVEYEIDTSEAGSAIWDEGSTPELDRGITEAEMVADQNAIDRDHMRRMEEQGYGLPTQ